MDLFSFTVMSGTDDVIISGNLPLGIDNLLYNTFGECARDRFISMKGIENTNFKDCRGVSVFVEALQYRDQQTEPIIAMTSFRTLMPGVWICSERHMR